jgi:CPA2 family monovalent cation:H+ antiporter-2
MQRVGLTFVVIELDQRVVEKSKDGGVPTIFGDSSSSVVLEAAGVHHARLMLVTVPDPLDVQLIVSRVRAINPTLHVVARASGAEQLHDLKNLGVHEVVQPELEAGLEMVRQVLVHFQVAPTDIQRFSEGVHQELYAPLYGKDGKGIDQPQAQLLYQLQYANRTLAIEWVRVPPDSPLTGQTLSESAVRQRTGASIVAVMHENIVQPNPAISYRFAAEDVLAVLGTTEQVEAFRTLVTPESSTVQDIPQR